MNYSSSSPGNYGGPPGSTGPPGPGTPIMPSPQDSSNSGGENMYTMMKPVPGGNMPGVSDENSEKKKYKKNIINRINEIQ